MNQQIVHYIEQEILPRYESYDAAHRRDHIEGVIERSLQLAAHYPELNRDMVYVVAAYHDLGLPEGRELHHISSGRLLAEDERLVEWFTPDQVQTMREAIEDHRASASRPPRTLYGMIVAEADRQIVPEVVMRRTVQYGLAHYPHLDREGHWERFVGHLHEKYDYGGYLTLYIPHSDNAQQLETLRRLIADKTKLRERFEEIFEKSKVES